MPLATPKFYRMADAHLLSSRPNPSKVIEPHKWLIAFADRHGILKDWWCNKINFSECINALIHVFIKLIFLAATIFDDQFWVINLFSKNTNWTSHCRYYKWPIFLNSTIIELWMSSSFFRSEFDWFSASKIWNKCPKIIITCHCCHGKCKITETKRRISSFWIESVILFKFWGISKTYSIDME